MAAKNCANIQISRILPEFKNMAKMQMAIIHRV